MGGSLGMAAGEAFVTGAQTARARQTPFVIFAASGGARMQEGILSLMQMPRTTVAVQQLREAGLPYIVVLTDPTTGGVTASYAMLGDVHIAEPGALIGFAGPRVIEQTIREKLPPGFQRSEYLAEHGMVDMVVHRHDLRATLSRLVPAPDRRAVARETRSPACPTSSRISLRCRMHGRSRRLTAAGHDAFPIAGTPVRHGFVRRHSRPAGGASPAPHRPVARPHPAAAGRPRRPAARLPPVIHVAGTNGKGSTLAYLRAMLEAAGGTVHVYTSPHLVRFDERIRLGEGGLSPRPSSPRPWSECENANAGEPITFFEITTAAAFLALRATSGRLHAARGRPRRPARRDQCVRRPLVTVITPVVYRPPSLSRRHARADRLREGRHPQARRARVLIAPQAPRSVASIEDRRQKVGAPLVVSGQDFDASEERGRLFIRTTSGCWTCRCPASPAATSSTTRAPRSPLLRLLPTRARRATASRRGSQAVDGRRDLQRLTRRAAR